jgi:hypothetical protein
LQSASKSTYKERVVGLGVLKQPLEACNHVGTRRLRVALAVVSQHSHVLLVGRELEASEQLLLDVGNVVDAAAQLRLGARIVDADQQRLLVARASRLGHVQTVVECRRAAVGLGCRRGSTTGLAVAVCDQTNGEKKSKKEK